MIKGNNHDGAFTGYSEIVADKVIEEHPEIVVDPDTGLITSYLTIGQLTTMLQEAVSETERDMY